MRYHYQALACGLLFLASSVSAGALQSSAVVSAKVEVLERQVRELQQRLNVRGASSLPQSNDVQSNTGAGGDNALLADMVARMGTLERQLRVITGRLEEQDYRQREMEEQFTQLQAQVALMREQQLTAASQPETSPAQPVATGGGATANVERQTATVDAVDQPTAPIVALPEGDPTVQYNYAFSFVRRNDLASGKTAMEQFLAANPDDDSAANAKFWLGRINLQQGNAAEAARYYLTLIEEHPNHNRRPDALVDLADALVQIDAPSDACNALQEFRRVEDEASVRAVDSARRVDQSASCGLF